MSRRTSIKVCPECSFPMKNTPMRRVCENGNCERFALFEFQDSDPSGQRAEGNGGAAQAVPLLALASFWG